MAWDNEKDVFSKRYMMKTIPYIEMYKLDNCSAATQTFIKARVNEFTEIYRFILFIWSEMYY